MKGQFKGFNMFQPYMSNSKTHRFLQVLRSLCCLLWIPSLTIFVHFLGLISPDFLTVSPSMSHARFNFPWFIPRNYHGNSPDSVEFPWKFLNFLGFFSRFRRISLEIPRWMPQIFPTNSTNCRRFPQLLPSRCSSGRRAPRKGCQLWRSLVGRWSLAPMVRYRCTLW